MLMSSQSESVSSSATWHAVLPVADIPAEAIRAIAVGDTPLVVVRHGDDYAVLDRWCPHQGGDMAAGRVLANTLKCPLHGYMFSLATGRGLNCRGYSARVHEAQVMDG